MKSLWMKRGVLPTLLALTFLLNSCDNSTEPTKDEPIVHEWQTVLTADFCCTGLIEVPSSPGTLLLTGTQVFSGGIGGLYRSTDWGATWTEIEDSVDFINPSYIDCDQPRVYATAGIKYYSMNPVQSFDGGLTWSSITDTLPEIDFPRESYYSVFTHPSDPLELFLISTFLPSDFGGRSWRTSDGGINWIQMEPYNVAYLIEMTRNPLSPSTLAAFANGYFFISYDEGETWNQRAAFGTGSNLLFMDAEGQWIITNGDESMYETFDGGTTFTAFGEGLPEEQTIKEFTIYGDDFLVLTQNQNTAYDNLYLLDAETRQWSAWSDTSWIAASHLKVLGEYVFVVENDGEFNIMKLHRF